MISNFLFAGSSLTPLACLKKNFMVQAASTQATTMSPLRCVAWVHGSYRPSHEFIINFRKMPAEAVSKANGKLFYTLPGG